jgi:hypothetical protein
MKFRAAVATVATLPLALGLAACGNNDKPEAGRDWGQMPTASPTGANTAEPLKQAPVVHLNRTTFVPAMTTAMAKQKSWKIVGTMTANGATVMNMKGVQTSKPAAMSMEMSGAAFGSGTGKVLLVKGVVYVSIPGTTPAGKFVKIASKQTGQLGDLLDGGDPTKIYKSFDSSMASLKFVRTETIDGQKLDRYAVTVNTAKALAAQGKKVPAGVPKTLTYSLWMDKAHLVHRMSFALMGVSMVMTMSEYNKPVSITAPPASKIVR